MTLALRQAQNPKQDRHSRVATGRVAPRFQITAATPGLGDPAATRDAILAVVDAEDPPLRIFFGSSPLGIASRDYATRPALRNEWLPVSEAAMRNGADRCGTNASLPLASTSHQDRDRRRHGIIRTEAPPSLQLCGSGSLNWRPRTRNYATGRGRPNNAPQAGSAISEQSRPSAP